MGSAGERVKDVVVISSSASAMDVAMTEGSSRSWSIWESWTLDFRHLCAVHSILQPSFTLHVFISFLGLFAFEHVHVHTALL